MPYSVRHVGASRAELAYWVTWMTLRRMSQEACSLHRDRRIRAITGLSLLGLARSEASQVRPVMMFIMVLKLPVELPLRNFVTGNQTQARKWCGCISLWLRRPWGPVRLGVSLCI